MPTSRYDASRVIRAPRGTTLNCKSWLTEAAYRMIQNNLDAEVAEDPTALVVYGGIGRAARDWACYDKILETLKELNDDETLLIQSGKPVGVFPSHPDAPRVLLANSNLVPHWATQAHFDAFDCAQFSIFTSNKADGQSQELVFCAFFTCQLTVFFAARHFVFRTAVDAGNFFSI